MRDELEQLVVPLEALDRQLDADDAVRAHRRSPRRACATSPQLARVVHRLRQHAHLLVLAPAAVLHADVVDAGAHAQADRLEAGLAHEQELVDAEVGREHAGRDAPTCAIPSAARWAWTGMALGRVGGFGHIASSRSLDCVGLVMARGAGERRRDRRACRPPSPISMPARGARVASARWSR